MYLRLLLIVAIFSNLLEEWITIFTYSDEILTILFLLLSLVKIALDRKKKHKIFSELELGIFVLFFTALFIGVLSTFLSEYDTKWYLQLYTLFGDSKLILIYIGCRILFSNLSKTKIDNFGKFAIKVSYLYTAICIVMFITNLKWDYMIQFSHRFGFSNITYGFGHPSEYALAIILLTILNLYFNITLKRKINFIYVFINFFLLITAGRVTTIALFILLIILLYSFRYFRKYILGGVTLSCLGVFLFAKEKILETFIHIEEPRGILMITAMDIAKRFFPFGSGFATFGSNASRIEYSSLYYEYGFEQIWGFSPMHDMFLADSYWAMIIGEIGYIGAVLILIGLTLLFLVIYRINKGLVGFVISFPVIYIILTSFIDTVVVSNSSLPLMFVVGLLASFEIKNCFDCNENNLILDTV